MIDHTKCCCPRHGIQGKPCPDCPIHKKVTWGKTKSGWTWMCTNCGEGSIVDTRMIAQIRCKNHKCPLEQTS